LATPDHIAIIMDGNGRWAQERHLPRIAGHRAGVESVRAITEECTRRKLKQLTLYAFSRDNWKRPESEVKILMKYLRRYLVAERDNIMKNNIIFKTIGDVDVLPDEVKTEMKTTKEMSAANDGLTVCLALNYGGRYEITQAARDLAAKAAAGELNPDDIDEEMFANSLYTSGMPDPDLLIRTAGEMRVSDFLLYQISYSELYVTPKYWPDFREPDLEEAIDAFSKRSRRFGGLDNS
jgi:undecaprenyl diphosphate synthase